jgi:hypothetical protein
MLVLHVHIKGRHGTIERSYDFVRNDGKETLEGVDIVIPYEDDNPYPMRERDCIAWIHNKDLHGEH